LLPGRAGRVKMPTLHIHGDADQLCSPEGAQEWLRGAGTRDVTHNIYPGGRHEMFNETNKDEVLADMWKWMEARLA
jgi:alpha-beta hydrolase superfamily lysophospholipase